jgi:hypothetical protein
MEIIQASDDRSEVIKERAAAAAERAAASEERRTAAAERQAICTSLNRIWLLLSKASPEEGLGWEGKDPSRSQVQQNEQLRQDDSEVAEASVNQCQWQLCEFGANSQKQDGFVGPGGAYILPGHKKVERIDKRAGELSTSTRTTTKNVRCEHVNSVQVHLLNSQDGIENLCKSRVSSQAVPSIKDQESLQIPLQNANILTQTVNHQIPYNVNSIPLDGEITMVDLLFAVHDQTELGPSQASLSHINLTLSELPS